MGLLRLSLVFAAAATVSLAPAQPQSPGSSALMRMSPVGGWTGFFHCGGTRVPARLGIGGKSSSFGWGKAKILADGRPWYDYDGQYALDARFDPATRKIEALAGKWIKQPTGYGDIDHPLRAQPSNLTLQMSADGAKLTGTILHQKCGKIELTADGVWSSAEDYRIRESQPGARQSSPHVTELAKTSGIYVSWDHTKSCVPPEVNINIRENRQGALGDRAQLGTVEVALRRIMALECPSATHVRASTRAWDTPASSPPQIVEWSFQDPPGWSPPSTVLVASAAPPRGWAPTFFDPVETLPPGQGRYQAAYDRLKKARPSYVAAARRGIEAAAVAAPPGNFAERAATISAWMCMKDSHAPAIPESERAGVCYFAGLAAAGYVERIRVTTDQAPQRGQLFSPDNQTLGWSQAKSLFMECARAGGPRECALLAEYGAEATSIAGEITRARELARNASTPFTGVENTVKRAAAAIDAAFRAEDSQCLASARQSFRADGFQTANTLKVCSDAAPSLGDCRQTASGSTCTYLCAFTEPMSQVEYCARAQCGYGVPSMRRMCNGRLAKLDFFAESLGNGIMFKPRVF